MYIYIYNKIYTNNNQLKPITIKKISQPKCTMLMFQQKACLVRNAAHLPNVSCICIHTTLRLHGSSCNTRLHKTLLHHTIFVIIGEGVGGSLHIQ